MSSSALIQAQVAYDDDDTLSFVYYSFMIQTRSLPHSPIARRYVYGVHDV